jgi:hypothetical protein
MTTPNQCKEHQRVNMPRRERTRAVHDSATAPDHSGARRWLEPVDAFCCYLPAIQVVVGSGGKSLTPSMLNG